MADITDIKAIIYTEKTLGLGDANVAVIQTAPNTTKNGLKAILKEYFGITPLKINSLRVDGKVKRFKGEILTFGQIWEDVLKIGDPYYNSNLSLDRTDFSIKVK